jgi:hypothetical protein
MEARFFFSIVETKFLNIIYMSFDFRGLSNEESN